MSKYDVVIPEYPVFKEMLKKHLYENGLSKFYNEENAKGFYKLTDLFLNANARVNLSAIRDAEGTIVKHYCDCLYIADMIPRGATLLDVGCGGGFPTLPIAIVRRDVKITSLDSTEKKLKVVSDIAGEMKLNVTTLCARAEEAAHDKKYREMFDAVSARAVSSLDILTELCIPFVKVGGVFIAMKGSGGEDEYKKAEKGIGILGGALDTKSEPELEGMKRYIYIIKKHRKTAAEYPRGYAKICKSPL
ncbi:MAG: 16S rRNA (guanine(527)-N(7))-methyltransferase RsmG [Ruminococcaceae bacterium]|nr:16S rRNA (guanine(527)-N(7))-methyltransferase RsmG [Oscillospiraceae bacterium]